MEPTHTLRGHCRQRKLPLPTTDSKRLEVQAAPPQAASSLSFLHAFIYALNFFVLKPVLYDLIRLPHSRPKQD